jgi:V8-like Glu-specific endopeptidase
MERTRRPSLGSAPELRVFAAAALVAAGCAGAGGTADVPHDPPEVSFPAVSALPNRPDPPDPLAFEDGSPVVDAQAWKDRRRPEVLALLAHYAYGEVPAAAREAAVDVEDEGTFADALGGKAVLRNLRLRVGGDPPAATIRLLVVLPAGASAAAPAPVFLGLNFFGNHAVLDDPRVPLSEAWIPSRGEGVANNRATEASRGTDAAAWPVAAIVADGYGLATMYHGDVDPDRDDDDDGVQPRYRFPGAAPGPHEWGTVAAWAWGLSRAADALGREPAVDPARIAVAGHSRNGKAALLAAALDERFALAVSNQSGCMGAALSRGKDGETVAFITGMFPHWFADVLREFADRESRLPFDQHMLLAAIAPRPVLVSSATGDAWSDPAAESRSVELATPVSRLLGARAPEWRVRPGGHSVVAEDWTAFLAFADRAFGRGAGREPGVTSAIYQGDVEAGEPWVVAVHYPRPGTSKLRLCTGSVIAPRVVVTAKHCVHDESPEDVWTPVAASALTVSIGHSMIDGGGIAREVGVAGIRVTPGAYTLGDALAGDDLAVLVLDAVAGVDPVGVSTEPPALDDEVLIAGFGFTEDDVLGVKHSGSAVVDVVLEGTFETHGPAWTCTGDSGGPALHAGRRELLGVTSVGPKGCASPRSIYSRVDRHAAMIAKALADTGATPPEPPVGDAGPETPP